MKGIGGGNGLGGREMGLGLVSGSGSGWSDWDCGWRGEVGRGNLHWVKLWEVEEEEEEDSGSEG